MTDSSSSSYIIEDLLSGHATLAYEVCNPANIYTVKMPRKVKPRLRRQDDGDEPAAALVGVCALQCLGIVPEPTALRRRHQLPYTPHGHVSACSCTDIPSASTDLRFLNGQTSVREPGPVIDEHFMPAA